MKSTWCWYGDWSSDVCSSDLKTHRKSRAEQEEKLRAIEEKMNKKVAVAAPSKLNRLKCTNHHLNT